MDKYRVFKRIGVGTYGSAYLVTLKTAPHVQYVLKKVKVEQADDKERQSAEQEVKMLMLLAHPLVLSYVDHFMYKGHLCIVTDYCDAGDLYQMLRARKTALPEAQLLDLLVQVLMAIHYIHQKNILHRDLKTQNIFMTSEGNIKLGDFGISRSLNSTMDLASTIIGTPYYMSPEVMSSQPYDLKSDMWSLGCVLYEMMSLKHAFDASDMSSLVMKILRGEHLPIPQQFSQELRDLVRLLLNKNPKQRPSAEQVLKMPFLKDSVARAREVMVMLEARTAAARRMMEAHHGGGGGAPASHHRPSNGYAPEPGKALDRELEAAKERLRQIQLEREALHKQAYAGPGHGAAGVSSAANPKYSPPPLSVQNSEPALMPRHGALGLPPGPSGAAAAAAALRGRSYKGGDREDGPARMPPHMFQRPPAGNGALRMSPRAKSPDTGSYSLHSSVGLDPRSRMLQRKEEEARRREEELLSARRAYFEERKQAASKLQQLYSPSPQHRLTTRRATDGEGWGMHGTAGHGHFPGGAHGSPGTGSRETDYGSYNGGGAYASPSRRTSAAGNHQAPPAQQQQQQYGHHTGISSDDSELDEPYGDGAAHQEFEAELTSHPGGMYGGVPNHVFDAGAAICDRAAALRQICGANLGQPLYELIYGYVRKRMAQGIYDDPAFRSELLQRLGADRMQYVQLIDQIIFIEDSIQAGGM